MSSMGCIFLLKSFTQKVQGIRHPFDVPLPLDEANMESIVTDNHLERILEKKSEYYCFF